MVGANIINNLTGVKKPRLMEFFLQTNINEVFYSMCYCSTDFHHNKSISVMEDTPLSDYSERDEIWNIKKGASELLGEHLTFFEEFQKWGNNMLSCATIIGMNESIDTDTGLVQLKLFQADFCRGRHCPMCNWRRSLRLQASFYHFIPEFMEENPKARWLFLTLTVPNVPIEELGSTLTRMNQSWQRLSQRKALRPMKGFIRTTEVTREQKRKGYCHPHFHVLIQVESSYFQGYNYLSQAKWLELWRDCYRDQSISASGVNVKAVKGDISEDNVIQEVNKTFTYSIKIEDVVKPDNWLLEYFRQVHRRRFVVAGGSLKDAIKDMREIEDEENDDLIHVEGDKEVENKADSKSYFGWRDKEFIYRKTNPFIHKKD